ncbi:pyridoxal phosphate-dependent aminotransferase [Jeongeupia wiesaeckerbachi]|uniref:pyridoxal phosphate-dependent aminotransferase n=1 Tax=Jeongeupia wiesaeckerbachi TaxID=3051218 RepID=UPI003D8008FE
MPKRISPLLAEIAPSATYALFDMVQSLRARGISLLDLGGGEPDFATPAHISTAASTAIDDGWTHYTPSRGIPALLDAIAGKLALDNHVVIDPQTQVVVTPSAKHALFVALMTVLGPGDEVIIPTPSWVSYKAMAQMMGAQAVELPLDASNGFALTAAALAQKLSPRTRAILINSPNNPTGHMLDEHEAALIADFAEQHGLVIIADEIYEKIAYGKPHISIASLPKASDRTLTINGFSKAYAMTGWRLGYIAGPRDLIDAALTATQHTVGCAGAFIQQGGLAALTGDQAPITAMREAYDLRRKRVVDGLNAIDGLRCIDPDGAFYAFADISGLGLGSSAEVTQWLLREAGVVVTPGSAFGAGGEGYIRLSFATSTDVVTAAVERIRTAIADTKARRSNPLVTV